MNDDTLEDFVKRVSGEGHLRVEVDYGGGFVRLRTSEAERRQAAQDIRCTENIVLEMLRNSRDAHAAHIFVATSREGSIRRLTVIDDGCGIPDHMRELVFEPRVTSKLDSSHMDSWGLHGRGMALYSVAQNTKKARVACSGDKLGCAIEVESDTADLPEKADQSSFPTFSVDDQGVVQVRGPKNIVRTICEFAIQSRANCSVYVGSAAEICAVMLAYGTATLSAIDRLFCDDVTAIPVVKRLATAADPQEFAHIAESMGLHISERNARRIMDKEIDEAQNVLDRVAIERSNMPAKRRLPKNNRPIVKLSSHDRAALLDDVMRAYASLAEKYYLEPAVSPSATVKNNALCITIPLVRGDDS